MAQEVINGVVYDVVRIQNPSSGGGGGGGEVTIPEGGDVVVGTRSDPVVTDPNATATSQSFTKGQLKYLGDLASAIGAKAPGTPANAALLTGGIYNNALALRTNGGQSSLETDLRGSLRVRMHATTFASTDGLTNQVAALNGENDATGGTKPLATVQYGLDEASGTFNRFRMNGAKSLYVTAATPDYVDGSVTAQSITGTTDAAASLIATINNPGGRYKKAVIYVKNLSTNAFTSFIIKTKTWASRPSYETTYAGGEYIPLRGYLQEVSVDPSTLVDGESKIVLDISMFESLELRATVLSAVPGTTASATWRLLDV